jgi:hypothetical protein
LTGDVLPSRRRAWLDVNPRMLEVVVLVRSGVHRFVIVCRLHPAGAAGIHAFPATRALLEETQLI